MMHWMATGLLPIRIITRGQTTNEVGNGRRAIYAADVESARISEWVTVFHSRDQFGSRWLLEIEDSTAVYTVGRATTVFEM